MMVNGLCLVVNMNSEKSNLFKISIGGLIFYMFSKLSFYGLLFL